MVRAARRAHLGDLRRRWLRRDEKDKDVTIRVEGGDPQTVGIDGDVRSGDQLQVWRSEGIWHTGREYSLPGGLIMTVAIWLITGGTGYAVRRRSSGRRPRLTRVPTGSGPARG